MQPLFNQILDMVFQRSPMQRRKIQRFLSAQNENYLEIAQETANDFVKYLNTVGLTCEDWVSAYLSMCNDHHREQIRFGKTGTYEGHSLARCYESIYSNDMAMHRILLGLALTQLLWENHYKMFTFFKDALIEAAPDTYCEIGPGHGLFLLNAVKHHHCRQVMVVDISPKAIELSKGLLDSVVPEAKNVFFKIENILSSELEEKQFDFVTMGEVLEHVENPHELLLAIKRLLKDHGRAFITTCCNSPSADHVYLFKDVEEIHKLVRNVKFTILRELILPNGLSWVINGERREGINYAAVVT